MIGDLKKQIKNTIANYKESQSSNGFIIICPGGGYEFISEREGEPVAKAFRAKGWEAFVLNYSTGNNLCQTPLKELGAAVKEIKRNMQKYGINNKPIIVCGFSAGGHLAASLGVHWNDKNLFSNNHDYKPDALILCYPVITAGEYAHKDSISSLTEKEDSGYFSLENHVTKDTPPTFIWHTISDETVSVQNTILFTQALIENNVFTEVHLYPYGSHGLSLATDAVAEPENSRFADDHIATWFEQSLQWLNIIKKRSNTYDKVGK